MQVIPIVNVAQATGHKSMKSRLYSNATGCKLSTSNIFQDMNLNTEIMLYIKYCSSETALFFRNNLVNYAHSNLFQQKPPKII